MNREKRIQTDFWERFGKRALAVTMAALMFGSFIPNIIYEVRALEENTTGFPEAKVTFADVPSPAVQLTNQPIFQMQQGASTSMKLNVGLKESRGEADGVEITLKAPRMYQNEGSKRYYFADAPDPEKPYKEITDAGLYVSLPKVPNDTWAIYGTENTVLRDKDGKPLHTDEPLDGVLISAAEYPKAVAFSGTIVIENGKLQTKDTVFTFDQVKYYGDVPENALATVRADVKYTRYQANSGAEWKDGHWQSPEAPNQKYDPTKSQHEFNAITFLNSNLKWETKIEMMNGEKDVVLWDKYNYVTYKLTVKNTSEKDVSTIDGMDIAVGLQTRMKDGSKFHGVLEDDMMQWRISYGDNYTKDDIEGEGNEDRIHDYDPNKLKEKGKELSVEANWQYDEKGNIMKDENGRNHVDIRDETHKHWFTGKLNEGGILFYDGTNLTEQELADWNFNDVTTIPKSLKDKEMFYQYPSVGVFSIKLRQEEIVPPVSKDYTGKGGEKPDERVYYMMVPYRNNFHNKKDNTTKFWPTIYFGADPTQDPPEPASTWLKENIETMYFQEPKIELPVNKFTLHGEIPFNPKGTYQRKTGMDPADMGVGENARYYLDGIQNTGNVPAFDAYLIDTLPKDFTLTNVVLHMNMKEKKTVAPKPSGSNSQDNSQKSEDPDPDPDEQQGGASKTENAKPPANEQEGSKPSTEPAKPEGTPSTKGEPSTEEPPSAEGTPSTGGTPSTEGTPSAGEGADASNGAETKPETPGEDSPATPEDVTEKAQEQLSNALKDVANLFQKSEEPVEQVGALATAGATETEGETPTGTGSEGSTGTGGGGSNGTGSETPGGTEGGTPDKPETPAKPEQIEPELKEWFWDDVGETYVDLDYDTKEKITKNALEAEYKVIDEKTKAVLGTVWVPIGERDTEPKKTLAKDKPTILDEKGQKVEQKDSLSWNIRVMNEEKLKKSAEDTVNAARAEMLEKDKNKNQAWEHAIPGETTGRVRIPYRHMILPGQKLDGMIEMQGKATIVKTYTNQVLTQAQMWQYFIEMIDNPYRFEKGAPVEFQESQATLKVQPPVPGIYAQSVRYENEDTSKPRKAFEAISEQNKQVAVPLNGEAAALRYGLWNDGVSQMLPAKFYIGGKDSTQLLMNGEEGFVTQYVVLSKELLATEKDPETNETVPKVGEIKSITLTGKKTGFEKLQNTTTDFNQSLGKFDDAGNLVIPIEKLGGGPQYDKDGNPIRYDITSVTVDFEYFNTVKAPATDEAKKDHPIYVELRGYSNKIETRTVQATWRTDYAQLGEGAKELTDYSADDTSELQTAVLTPVLTVTPHWRYANGTEGNPTATPYLTPDAWYDYQFENKSITSAGVTDLDFTIPVGDVDPSNQTTIKGFNANKVVIGNTWKKVMGVAHLEGEELKKALKDYSVKLWDSSKQFKDEASTTIPWVNLLDSKHLQSDGSIVISKEDFGDIKNLRLVRIECVEFGAERIYNADPKLDTAMHVQIHGGANWHDDFDRLGTFKKGLLDDYYDKVTGNTLTTYTDFAPRSDFFLNAKMSANNKFDMVDFIPQATALAGWVDGAGQEQTSEKADNKTQTIGFMSDAFYRFNLTSTTVSPSLVDVVDLDFQGLAERTVNGKKQVLGFKTQELWLNKFSSQYLEKIEFFDLSAMNPNGTLKTNAQPKETVNWKDIEKQFPAGTAENDKGIRKLLIGSQDGSIAKPSETEGGWRWIRLHYSRTNAEMTGNKALLYDVKGKTDWRGTMRADIFLTEKEPFYSRPRTAKAHAILLAELDQLMLGIHSHIQYVDLKETEREDDKQTDKNNTILGVPYDRDFKMWINLENKNENVKYLKPPVLHDVDFDTTLPIRNKDGNLFWQVKENQLPKNETAEQKKAKQEEAHTGFHVTKMRIAKSVFDEFYEGVDEVWLYDVDKPNEPVKLKAVLADDKTHRENGKKVTGFTYEKDGKTISLDYDTTSGEGTSTFSKPGDGLVLTQEKLKELGIERLARVDIKSGKYMPETTDAIRDKLRVEFYGYEDAVFGTNDELRSRSTNYYLGMRDMAATDATFKADAQDLTIAYVSKMYFDTNITAAYNDGEETKKYTAESQSVEHIRQGDKEFQDNASLEIGYRGLGFFGVDFRQYLHARNTPQQDLPVKTVLPVARTDAYASQEHSWPYNYLYVHTQSFNTKATVNVEVELPADYFDTYYLKMNPRVKEYINSVTVTRKDGTTYTITKEMWKENAETARRCSRMARSRSISESVWRKMARA